MDLTDNPTWPKGSDKIILFYITESYSPTNKSTVFLKSLKFEKEVLFI